MDISTLSQEQLLQRKQLLERKQQLMQKSQPTTLQKVGQGALDIGKGVVDIARETVKPAISSLVYHPLQGLEGLATGGLSAIQGKGWKPTMSTYDVPGLGKIEPIKSYKESLGKTAQTAALIPGVGPTVGGGLFAGGGAAAQNKPPLEIAGRGLLGAGLGKGLDILGKRFLGGDKGLSKGEELVAKQKKVPAKVIERIKSKGKDKILKRRQELGEHGTEDVIARVQEGSESFKQMADDAYKGAVGKFDKTYVDASDFVKELETVIQKTSRVSSPITSEIRTMYEVLTKGKKALIDDTGKVFITKNEIFLIRDKINRMFKELPSDRSAMTLKESLYKSAEKAGMKGLNEARALERKAFAIEKAATKLTRGKKLFNYENLTQTEKDTLKWIQEEIGDDFIGDLEDISAGKFIDTITQAFKARQARNFGRVKKIGLGLAGTGAAGFLLRKPIEGAIDFVAGD